MKGSLALLPLGRPRAVSGSDDPFLARVAMGLEALFRAAEIRDRAGARLVPTALRARDLMGDQPPVQFGDLSGPPLAPDGLLRAHLELLLDATVAETGGAPAPSATWSAREPDGLFKVLLAVDRPQTPSQAEDFAFSYAVLPPSAESGPAGYAAAYLQAALDVVDILADGAPVLPASVVIAGQRAAVRLPGPSDDLRLDDRVQAETRHKHHQPIQSVSATEPRIVYLARQWGLLSQHVVADGKAVDGFRLRELEEWCVDCSGHPAVVYEYLARVCNLACKFCYLFGNPAGLAVARGAKVVSRAEIDTRLKYYRPQAQQSLFQAQWELNEFLIDPKLADVLVKLREQTAFPFFFTTNGNPLSPEVIALLKRTEPANLIISVNSLDAEVRAAVMGEKNASRTRTALACFEELMEHEIPFGVSLAAFPDFSLAELEKTIRGVNDLGRVSFIRVNLPGYTRDHPYQMEGDLEGYWREVSALVRKLRSEVAVPLILIPSAFEDNVLESDPLAARVTGTVPNSPAARAELKPGDVIARVNNIKVSTRAEAGALLSLPFGALTVTVERDGESLVLPIADPTSRNYPFTDELIGKYYFPLGVVMNPCLSRLDADAVHDIATKAGARSVWIMTSRLMAPAARALLPHSRKLAESGLSVELVPVRNDFLGGNIQVMDMATVTDIGRTLEARLAESALPDLVLIPPTGFNRYGRDLAGRHWADLDRAFGFPVRLIETATQFMF